MEGTVIRRHGDDRLLIDLAPSQRHACLEIDAQTVEFLENRAPNGRCE